jgi:hypothetical protein
LDRRWRFDSFQEKAGGSRKNIKDRLTLVLIERVGLSNVVHRAFHRFQDIVGKRVFSYAPKCPGRMPSVEQSPEDSRFVSHGFQHDLGFDR